MRTSDQLIAVTKCFNLGSIQDLTPALGADLEEFYLDEESEDSEEGVSIPDDLRSVGRRGIALEALLLAHEGDIAWLYGQVEQIAFEAQRRR
mgnify:FL=1